MNTKIPTFIINLEKRYDRRIHIQNEFEKRNEFDFRIVSATQHNIGAIGLWKTMRNIIEQAKMENYDYILICEDDHQFTDNYNESLFIKTIHDANKLQADLLLGGVSYFEDAVELDKGLFWLNKFTGTQFFIIYKRFFDIFLNITLNDDDNIDLKINEISDQIYCLYPFISIQKEFGYSDVTQKNEGSGTVNDYFHTTTKRLATLSYLKTYFEELK
ncbi:hypothetical protein SF1_36540 [Sphingobacterium faecium NBRC 15299]|uniref:glycosyl transferase n=1 Tax=Sphingobacterium faecium TaxID=34087 RepID=UPI000D393A5F|nr:glycosyl transferase [Sphingobacterium faecium]PTX07160.1 glycosyl transferase family 25 [Sphingobacterium faecium]GEM65672.1 hypothetical protein SF1_36540 [Sphingobacterium faecium NBRC 15299]